MTLPIDPSDWLGLVRDPHPAVSTAALALLKPALDHADRSVVAGALWDLAGTDAYEALPWVMPVLAHPSADIGRMALLALRSLHPLCGLPRRSGPLPDARG